VESEQLSDCRSRTIAQPNPNYFGRVAAPGADGQVIGVFGNDHEAIYFSIFPYCNIVRFLQANGIDM
jgi:hypothetical protein